jgi:antirestriction protein ArdC
MPWHRSGVSTNCPVNAFTGQPYQGVNVLSLWADASLKAFASGHWATFKQWRCLGARVRKGEKGSPIVFYKRYVAGQPCPQTAGSGDSPGEPQASVRWFARTSWAFNAEQVDGWSPPNPPVRSEAEILAQAERFVEGTGAVIRHGGDNACYRPREDVIVMPPREAFSGTATSNATESCYAILFHELTHWTGHRSRLDRQLSNRFGEAAYAMEELVAELGASFLCAECCIASEPRPDHACYIANWLDVLKNDRRAIFTAAHRAREAAAFLVAMQTKDTERTLPQAGGGVQ